jgi:hypothetical protein
MQLLFLQTYQLIHGLPIVLTAVLAFGIDTGGRKHLCVLVPYALANGNKLFTDPILSGLINLLQKHPDYIDGGIILSVSGGIHDSGMLHLIRWFADTGLKLSSIWAIRHKMTSMESIKALLECKCWMQHGYLHLSDGTMSPDSVLKFFLWCLINYKDRLYYVCLTGNPGMGNIIHTLQKLMSFYSCDWMVDIDNTKEETNDHQQAHLSFNKKVAKFRKEHQERQVAQENTVSKDTRELYGADGFQSNGSICTLGDCVRTCKKYNKKKSKSTAGSSTTGSSTTGSSTTGSSTTGSSTVGFS